MDDSKEYIKMCCGLPDDFWSDFPMVYHGASQFCKNCLSFVRDSRLACCDMMNRKQYPGQDTLQAMVGDFKEQKKIISILFSPHWVARGMGKTQK